MLIKFSEIVNKYNQPKGIIHLGAHLAEELNDYLEFNIKDVIWVEANPRLYEELKVKINGTNHIAISELLSDVDGVEMKFNIAKNYYNGNYQSSSVLEFGSHEINHPHIKMEDSMILKSKTINTIFSENKFDFNNYDFLNLDLQGYELPVIKGFGDNISKMKYIYTEVNTGEVYKNCTKLNELDEYLGEYGFIRVEIEMTDAEWGDALYIKKENNFLIFDIGANIGDFTNRCLENISNSKIISIEPNNDLFENLKNRFKYKNVEILDLLVSNKSNEILDFYISNADTISTASKDWVENSRFSNSYNWNNIVKKNTITIDDLILKYGNPDLIKIDVEGYEYEVISGLSKRQKNLCFEWVEEKYDILNKTCEYLKLIGYNEFGFTYGDDHLLKPTKWTSWEDCDIHKDIDINRKDKWGMIWVR